MKQKNNFNQEMNQEFKKIQEILTKINKQFEKRLNERRKNTK